MSAVITRASFGRVAAVALTALCALPVPDAAAAPPTYTITDLGSFGAGTSLNGQRLNDVGQVVGLADIESTPYPFLSNGIAHTDIIGPTGFYPTSFSDTGFIVGETFDVSNRTGIGFGYDTGSKVLTYYGTFVPGAVNSHGQIVGNFGYPPPSPPGSPYRLLFSLDGRTLIDLAPLLQEHFAPLSQQGITVGGVTAAVLKNNGLLAATITVSGNQHWLAFALNINDIATLGLNTRIIDYGPNLLIQAINENGQAVGLHCAATDVSPDCPTAIADSSDLHDVGGTFHAAAINNAGLVVGYNGSALVLNNNRRAVLYDDEVVYDLNNLIAPGDPLKSVVTFSQAVDINNNGEILVWGDQNAGQSHSFLLKPVVVPVVAGP